VEGDLLTRCDDLGGRRGADAVGSGAAGGVASAVEGTVRTVNRFSTFALSVALVVIPGESWAGKGWYLLVPSLSRYDETKPFLQGYRVLDTERLSKWNHAGAYDTAAECETDKSIKTQMEQSVYTRSSEYYMRLLSGGADAPALKLQRLLAEQHNAQTNALLSGRCIVSDDPRLR